MRTIISGVADTKITTAHLQDDIQAHGELWLHRK